MREEFVNGMQGMEKIIASNIGAMVGELGAELAEDKRARQNLKDRVVRLEQSQKHEDLHRRLSVLESQRLHPSHGKDAGADLDNSVDVIGGFGNEAVEETESMVREPIIAVKMPRLLKAHPGLHWHTSILPLQL